ncbi:MAG: cation transporter dimerization domain-containing protein [Acidilobaceae archaeon]
MSELKLFLAILALSFAGGLTKMAGGLLYGSKSLLVDAITCFANLLVAIAMVVFYKLSLREPDADHMYGHRRLRLASIAVATSTYSLVLGFLVSYILLTSGREYSVEYRAPLLAILGSLFYGLAVLLGRRAGVEGEVYARYTYGELLESAIGVIASSGGAFYHYLVDLAGAILLVVFWAGETARNSWTLINIVADRVEPSLSAEVREYLKSRGYLVKSLRFREAGDRLIGDMIVILPGSMSVEKAHEIASLIEKELVEKYKLEVTIHIEPDSSNS